MGSTGVADKPDTSFLAVVAGGGLGGSITGREAVFGSVSMEILNRDNPIPIPAMPKRKTRMKSE